MTQANYFAMLADRSTDIGVMENKILEELYLKRNAQATVQFLRINPKSVDADGIIDHIITAFTRIRICNFREKLVQIWGVS